ncbi:autoinducer binding domain-containing protein [Bosea beijingensis]
MDGQFQALIDAADLARDERAMRQALKNFVAACGFDSFAYVYISSTDVTGFSDYPLEWQNLYRQKLYSRIDPVVAAARRASKLFAWSAEDWPARRITPAEKQFLSEAVSFGIRSGVTIPMETSFGGFALLTLATSRPRAELSMFRDIHRAATAIAYVHLRFEMITGGLLSDSALQLSPQEAVCLNWSSLGKYMPEIAKILGVEHRTVQYHLDNARDKLRAVNLPHAVRIALENDLLS